MVQRLDDLAISRTDIFEDFSRMKLLRELLELKSHPESSFLQPQEVSECFIKCLFEASKIVSTVVFMRSQNLQMDISSPKQWILFTNISHPFSIVPGEHVEHAVHHNLHCGRDGIITIDLQLDKLIINMRAMLPSMSKVDSSFLVVVRP